MRNILRIRVTQSAKKDLRQIISFYEKEKEGLGRRFIAQFEVEKDKLKVFSAYEIKFKDVRTKKMAIFPYHIFYRIVKNDSEIIVDAVMHVKQQKPW